MCLEHNTNTIMFSDLDMPLFKQNLLSYSNSKNIYDTKGIHNFLGVRPITECSRSHCQL
jgi:hypothetical protein